MSENIAIRVRGVSKSFGDAEVLHAVSRDFEEGKIHGIVGNNGSLGYLLKYQYYTDNLYNITRRGIRR